MFWIVRGVQPNIMVIQNGRAGISLAAQIPVLGLEQPDAMILEFQSFVSLAR